MRFSPLMLCLGLPIVLAQSYTGPVPGGMKVSQFKDCPVRGNRGNGAQSQCKKWFGQCFDPTCQRCVKGTVHDDYCGNNHECCLPELNPCMAKGGFCTRHVGRDCLRQTGIAADCAGNPAGPICCLGRSRCHIGGGVCKNIHTEKCLPFGFERDTAMCYGRDFFVQCCMRRTTGP